jgi:hypothetical protein
MVEKLKAEITVVVDSISNETLELPKIQLRLGNSIHCNCILKMVSHE